MWREIERERKGRGELESLRLAKDFQGQNQGRDKLVMGCAWASDGGSAGGFR